MKVAVFVNELRWYLFCYHLSINSELSNYQKPGPRFFSLLSKDIDRGIAQWSEKMLSTILAFCIADSMLFEIKRYSLICNRFFLAGLFHVNACLFDVCNSRYQ